MHTVFWDVLRGDLAADPPRYEHVIKLIGEAKEVCCLIEMEYFQINFLCFLGS
jgi:hypothetical protein